ncbi:Benzoyl-CoA reductase subunit C [subsurface metagenome]
MTALEELTKPADTLTNPYIERWKEKGGKVIGYYCTYVPIEVMHAAGMLPYRMRATGSTSSELGDLYSDHLICTFVRHSLDQAMRGEYKFLDGLVAAFSCDHIRRMFDVWRYGKIETAQPPFYLRFLSVPFTADDAAVEWLAAELERFKWSLEKHFQMTITDDDLRESIKAYNEKRRLLKSLYELRKKESPPVTGAEVLRIVIASTAMPVEEFNQLMKKMLDEVNGRDGFSDYRARLMLAGGELENPAYIEVIEELGGLVVIDYLCFGVRDFWDLVDEDAEPLVALAKRYLYRISCPRNMGHRERVTFINDMLKEFKADGVIVERLKFCDAWGGEGAMLEWKEREAGIPCMVLEREYLMAGLGQLRTRAQAFLEMIEKR